MSMYVAAIGTDGTRPVVWGLGDDQAEARDDAHEQDGCPEEITFAMVGSERAGLIRAGDVDASDLWPGKPFV